MTKKLLNKWFLLASMLMLSAPLHAQEYVPSVPANKVPTLGNIDILPEQPEKAKKVEPAKKQAILPLENKKMHMDTSRLLEFSILNKQTTRLTGLEVNEGGSVTHGQLNLRLIECWHSAPDSRPESAALLEIHEKGTTKPIFLGWMFSASPSINPLEHAVYDVLITECK